MSKRNAQVWFLDFMVGLMIFMIVVFIYYNYQNNLTGDVEAVWDEMIIDSKAISSSLMSQGYPQDWNETTVERIGLLNGSYRLSQERLEAFAAMPYNLTTSLFNTRFEFYFFLESQNGTESYATGMEPAGQKYLVQATRLAIYNSSVYRMVLYLWTQ